MFFSIIKLGQECKVRSLSQYAPVRISKIVIAGDHVVEFERVKCFPKPPHLIQSKKEMIRIEQIP